MAVEVRAQWACGPGKAQKFSSPPPRRTFAHATCTGYGYVNGIDAPNWHGSSPYGNYTMEGWFKLGTGITNAGILEFGRAGSVYVSAKTVYLRNGDDVTGGITIPDPNLGNWHFV